MISICPEKIQNFGVASGAEFVLLTTPTLMSQFQLRKEGEYNSYSILPIRESLTATIEFLPSNSHILVIAPEFYLRSVEPRLVGQRKVAIMATNSTPTPIEAIEYFVAAIEHTNPFLQQKKANEFFASLERSEGLILRDRQHQTQADLSLSSEQEWHEQVGQLEYGQQQIFPSGEVSVLPLKHGKFDPRTRLKLNGQITFSGRPIVHTGQRQDRLKQSRLFAKLEVLERYPAIATVEDGAIVNLKSAHPAAKSAVVALNALFEEDSSYAVVWELGFGINNCFELFPGNIAMNEVYGANDIVLHVGLGLTTATEFHLDLLCPNTQIQFIDSFIN